MNIVEAGMFSALSSDGDITTKLGGVFIYNSVAPQAQAQPYIIFTFAGGGRENINPSALVNVTYLVKAISDDPTEAGEIDTLIETALHGVTLTVTGYTNFHTQREDEVQLVETTTDGKFIYHRGAFYRIRMDN